MHPHTKKVVMMTAISLGIIMFAYMIPVFVIPVALGVSEITNCTDYGCTSSAFTKCGGFSSSSSEDSSSSFDSWTRGMKGMLCLIGLDMGTSANTFAGQIILNKV